MTDALVSARAATAADADAERAANPMAGLGTPRTHATHAARALGFWFYLMSDAVIFAVLFANYIVLLHGVADGPQPHQIVDLRRAALETAILLTSSLTFGLVSLNALSGKKGAALFWLLATFLLGATFIGLELQEFLGLIAKGQGPARSGYMSGFFALVGTHGFHVLLGLMMIAVVGLQIIVKGLTEPVLSRLYRAGLFWHFLDVVWVGVFSVVYLAGRLT